MFASDQMLHAGSNVVEGLGPVIRRAWHEGRLWAESGSSLLRSGNFKILPERTFKIAWFGRYSFGYEQSSKELVYKRTDFEVARFQVDQAKPKFIF